MIYPNIRSLKVTPNVSELFCCIPQGPSRRTDEKRSTLFSHNDYVETFGEFDVRIHFPDSKSYFLMSTAGLPATTLHGGNVVVTTALAPTTLLCPRTNSPLEQKITAPYPNQQLRPMVIRPPAVVPWSWIGVLWFEYS